MPDFKIIHMYKQKKNEQWQAGYPYNKNMIVKQLCTQEWVEQKDNGKWGINRQLSHVTVATTATCLKCLEIEKALIQQKLDICDRQIAIAREIENGRNNEETQTNPDHCGETDSPRI